VTEITNHSGTDLLRKRITELEQRFDLEVYQQVDMKTRDLEEKLTNLRADIEEIIKARPMRGESREALRAANERSR